MSLPQSILLRHTLSICPACATRLRAEYRQEKDGIYLVRSCPQHGTFRSIAWRTPGFLSWLGDYQEAGLSDAVQSALCPTGCGLCEQHRAATCCVLLEVTSHCNLQCRFCFAGDTAEPEPSLQRIAEQIRDLTVPGETLLQLSGGEPTLRDDLPQIVAIAKQAGCRYVQLNTNGLRLAEDAAYLHALAQAGVSFVFMQFDAVDDSVYRTLRGRDLLRVKEEAIRACAAEGIGVTLVPTIVPGVNTEQIGAILDYAIARSPAVRGVHFQPVCHMGRTPEVPSDAARYTLDQLMDDLQAQSGGRIMRRQLLPSCCDHPLCGFHSDFMVLPDGTLYALAAERSEGNSCCGKEAETRAEACCGTGATAKVEACCSSGEVKMMTPECCSSTEASQAAAKNRAFVARRWQRPPLESGESEAAITAESEPETPQTLDLSDMQLFLQRVRSHGFTVTAMAFQDSGHLDLERLRRCSLHVYKDGKHVPFCAYYLQR